MSQTPEAPPGASERLAHMLATWFGAGFLPKAPGTWGSLAALPLAWLLLEYGGILVLALATLLFFALGVWASGIYLRSTHGEDPSEVVIDEVVGQWLTILAFVRFTPFADNLILYALAFAAFRLFDIWKPPPIGLAERRLDGGFGIMADDVIAALYAALAGVALGAAI